jgi:hypothetical protein
VSGDELFEVGAEALGVHGAREPVGLQAIVASRMIVTCESIVSAR